MAIRLLRTCKKCGQKMPLEDFTYVESCKYGRGYTCKVCKEAVARKRRETLKKIREKVATEPVFNRKCTHCGETKVIQDFAANPACIGGRGHICKDCKLKLHTAWRLKKKQQQAAAGNA